MGSSDTIQNNNKQLLPITVAGNLNIDLIIRQVPQLPLWGQEVAGIDHIAISSGQGGYMALALARLGVPLRMVGNLGKDPFGTQILNDLESYGVDTHSVDILEDKKTGITVGIVREDGERAFVSDFGCSRSFTKDLLARHWDVMLDSSIVGFVGIFCLPNLRLPDIGNAMCELRKYGVRTMLDTGWDPNNWQPETLTQLNDVLNHTSLFIPNLDEARILSGADRPEDAARKIQDMGVETVVIKLGSQGSLALVGDTITFAPAFTTTVFDTVGAGDEFDAGFLKGYRLGWNIEACLGFGNAAAAYYISKDIDRYPTTHQAMEILAQYQPDLKNRIVSFINDPIEKQ